MTRGREPVDDDGHASEGASRHSHHHRAQRGRRLARTKAVAGQVQDNDKMNSIHPAAPGAAPNVGVGAAPSTPPSNKGGAGGGSPSARDAPPRRGARGGRRQYIAPVPSAGGVGGVEKRTSQQQSSREYERPCACPSPPTAWLLGWSAPWPWPWSGMEPSEKAKLFRKANSTPPGQVR